VDKFIYIYKAAASVSVCLSVFPISQQRADLFRCNFSWFKGVIGRRDRKNPGKLRPLMCKISENGAKLPTSRRPPRAFCTAQWPCAHACTLAVFGPIACWPGGVARSLWCGTVSNAIEALWGKHRRRENRGTRSCGAGLPLAGWTLVFCTSSAEIGLLMMELFTKIATAFSETVYYFFTIVCNA